MSVGDPFMSSYMPILVVDANAQAAQQLAAQLRHSGFQTDVAISCVAAQAAARARHYGSFVVVLDPSQAVDLDCIAKLRRKAPRVWLIAISAMAPPLARKTLFRSGADALLVAPFSMADLISRISAFSHRSRPP
jgi:DNA-binding response OmpR family regulator